MLRQVRSREYVTTFTYCRDECGGSSCAISGRELAECGSYSVDVLLIFM